MTALDRRSPSLQNNPRLGSWLAVSPQGEILVRSGKVELGQGILLALAQIVADELGVDLGQVRMVPADTEYSPNESYTAGSLSVQHSGAALRQVCAEVRALYLESAAARLGCDKAELRVVDGTISGPGQAVTSYWELADDALLDRDATGAASPQPSSELGLVGRSLPRPDLVGKISGRPSYIQDMRPPGLVFGRPVRPPSPGAVLVDLDEDKIRAVSGVIAVVRDGSFVGVVATREELAVRAAEVTQGACTWREQASLPDQEQLAQFLTTAPAKTEILHRAGTLPGDTPDGEFGLHDGAISALDNGDDGEVALHARFSRPFLAHASIGPSCGVAIWTEVEGDPVLRVWSHSQGIHNLRNALASSLDLNVEQVVVSHADGAGCYGHNGADDAALDAALLARAVPGRPVQVVWSRHDELTWSPLGPAMVVDVTVKNDSDGMPRHWQHEIWSNGHSGRPWSPGHPPLLAACHCVGGPEPVPAGDPPMSNGGGAGRNSIPGYDLESVRVVSHNLATMPVRTSALRSLGAHLNVYAVEQVIDELAVDAGVDPIAYRLRLMSDDRARAVLQAAADLGGWTSPLPTGTVGRGIGWARYKQVGAYCAVVAEVEAEASLRVTRLSIAADVGAPINPDGVRNQLEGGALQALSWTVIEQVRFDNTRLTSGSWEDYPILKFSDVPRIDVVLVGRSDSPPLGAGETSVGPTGAAIGNALAAALGVRVRNLPLSPENIVAAMD